ncbi:MAG: DUF983 domain-containing protein [Thermomicrobiales bacterium]|nr:DUF983 domain-containing protein [Thermomicrobiales bacterium]
MADEETRAEEPAKDVASLLYGPVPWPNLPPPGWARVRTLLGRALTLRCPYCGGGHIFKNYFELKEICPTCEVKFEREEGYFLGGYVINLVFVEFLALGLALYLFFLGPLQHLDIVWMQLIGVLLAAGIPLLAFPYSRTLWIAIDLILNPPHEKMERYLRTSDLHPPRRPS